MNKLVLKTAALAAMTAAAATAPAHVRAQTAADSVAIRATAEDYIQGWYAGDADRMAAALHPELVKRIHLTDPRQGRTWVDDQGRSQLVAGTAAGGGSNTETEARRADIAVLDVFRGAAVVRIDAAGWVDYLQLVREADRWFILNVLWELREPQERTGVH